MPMSEQFELIKKACNCINDDTSDKEIIQKMITKNSLYLLEESSRCISNGKSTFAFPLLRQVYEYSIIQMGFMETLLTVNEFVNADHNLVGRLSEKIYGVTARDSGREKAEEAKEFFKFIKQILNRHTHANVDRLLAYSVENDFGPLGKNFFAEDAAILYDLIELIFLSSMKTLFKLDFKINKLDLSKYGIKLQQLKSSSEQIPDIFSRMMKIESVKLKLSAKKDEMTKTIMDLKNSQN